MSDTDLFPDTFSVTTPSSPRPVVFYTPWRSATRQNVITPILRQHSGMLKDEIPNANEYRPLIITILPRFEITTNSSEINTLILKRYDEIESRLKMLPNAEFEDDRVEAGAVDTARALIGQLRQRQLAPPELSWHGGDAIVMLWANRQRQLALTITEGEFGYVMRDDGKTVERKSNILPSSFGQLKLG